MIQFAQLESPFELESGESLENVTIAYQTYGTLNKQATNVVFVSHALTGSTDAAEWWKGLIGEGKLIDPAKYFIICPNAIGSCYGSTGPESINPATGVAYGEQFPQITLRDIARSYLLLLRSLHLTSVQYAIGGSMGAMVLTELAVLEPLLVQQFVLIATSASHSSWRLAFSTTIRRTIESFANAYSDRTQGLREGMRVARQFAMTSYRSAVEFDARFGREKLSSDPGDYFANDNLFEVESYLEHQGQKIVDRFSPHSYITLTRAMELYDIERGRSGDAQEILSSVTAKVLTIGIDTDILYAEDEVRAFSGCFSNGQYATLRSPYGHDSFLVDNEALCVLLQPIFAEEAKLATKSRTRKTVTEKEGSEVVA